MSRETQDIATVGHTASQFAEYLAEGHDLCRKIAPLDLAGHPLYIVAQSQIASEFGKAEGCHGYTSPSLDLYLQEFFDDWQGRGPCMVVNDIAIDDDQDPDFHHRVVINCILHELAHIVDRPEAGTTPIHRPPKDQVRSTCRCQFHQTGGFEPADGRPWTLVRAKGNSSGRAGQSPRLRHRARWSLPSAGLRPVVDSQLRRSHRAGNRAMPVPLVPRFSATIKAIT